ncbi:MAG: SUMF1/EgtB/PvdO family nonheme iron enzyme, partial [Chitinivibrionia bacterium]|nr:SUMF1/EgtB/PvdO family nonheme iron enzyme [Chitinivibrionia bacterium]
MKLTALLKSLALTALFTVSAFAQITVANWNAEAISIATAADLRELATRVNGGNNFSGRTITLANNIDLDGTPEWVPIGNTEARAFMGTFDGNGRTVSGVKINNTSTDGNLGFFGVVGNSGVVRNLSLNVNINGNNLVGAIAAINRGTIEEVRASGRVVAPIVGGLVAENRGIIRNFYSTTLVVPATAEDNLPAIFRFPLNPNEGDVFVFNTHGMSMEFVYVAPGTFMFGACASTTPATAGTSRTISTGFWIGRYPVTQAQYLAVMGSFPVAQLFPDRPSDPVTNVSWNDITAANGFLARIGARLPTSEEWEFAARGGNRRGGNNGSVDFIWAGSDDVNAVAWYWNHPNRPGGTNNTQPVGGLAANELGIHDMSGNVWEWTNTALGSNRVIRGGCWSTGAGNSRVVFGGSNNSPDDRWFSRGFRVAISPQLLAMAVSAQTAENFGGGAVGVNFGTIENGYSTGSIWVNSLSAQSTIGGLVGQNQGTITHSFFDSQRSGRSDNDGRGIPRTTAQMRQRTTFAHWDIENIWGMDALMYDGAPFLRTFYPLSRAKFTIDGQRTAVSPAPANLISSAMPYTGINLHTGSPIQPNVQIEYNGEPLTLGTDFELEFNDNTAISNNTNPARMRIIGMGDFAGTTLGYNFFITDPRDIRATTVSSIPDQIHRGTQQIRPQVVVRDFNNQLILQEDTDYFLDFGANNTIGNNAGSVRIIGDGIYQGEERTVRFNIVEARPINTTNTT